MSFGNNYYGQLGLGGTMDRDVPTLIPTLNDVKEIAGYYHSLFLLSKYLEKRRFIR